MATADGQNLRLELVPQHDRYVEREPVLIEWTLRNAGPAPLRVFSVPEVLLITSLECTDTTGRFVGIPPSETISLARNLPTVSLPPGGCLRGWLNVSNYGRFGGGGTYRVRAVLNTKDLVHSPNTYGAKITSGTAEFSVDNAAGDDAAVVALIDRHLMARHDPVGAFVFERSPELCRQIINGTKSKRFTAVAAFYLGRSTYPDGERNDNPDRLREAAKWFDQCAANPGASPSFKSLAAYYALRCNAEPAMALSPGDIADRAAAVNDAYPGTFGAWAASELTRSRGLPPGAARRNETYGTYAPAASVASALLVVIMLAIGLRRTKRRRAAATCRRCGYDLRGNPASGRCPECGTPVQAPAPAAADQSDHLGDYVMRAEWFLLFPSSKRPASDVIIARLRVQGFHAEAKRSSAGVPYIDVSDGPLRLKVVLNTARSVADESAEIAREHGATEADRLAIGRCDARFEITWPIGDSAEITNTLAIVTETISQLIGSGAYIFDAGAEQFI